jgi:hypothetical protein
MVEQYVRRALPISDHVYLMDRGSIAAEGGRASSARANCSTHTLDKHATKPRTRWSALSRSVILMSGRLWAGGTGHRARRLIVQRIAGNLGRVRMRELVERKRGVDSESESHPILRAVDRLFR